MPRWFCPDCSVTPKPGRRAACPLCCGFNTREVVTYRLVAQKANRASRKNGAAA
jgi:hypothetical protein